MKWCSNACARLTSRPSRRMWRFSVIRFGTFALLLAAASPTWAESTDASGIHSGHRHLTIVLGTAMVVESPVPLKRVSLVNPDVADAIVLSPREIYLTGKAPGRTTVTLWPQLGPSSSSIDVTVTPDVDSLRRQLQEFLPEETGIRLDAAADHVTLRGTVTSEQRRKQVIAMAEAYAPHKIIDLLTVASTDGPVTPRDPTSVVEVIRGTQRSEVRFESANR